MSVIFCQLFYPPGVLHCHLRYSPNPNRVSPSLLVSESALNWYVVGRSRPTSLLGYPHVSLPYIGNYQVRVTCSLPSSWPVRRRARLTYLVPVSRCHQVYRPSPLVRRRIQCTYQNAGKHFLTQHFIQRSWESRCEQEGAGSPYLPTEDTTAEKRTYCDTQMTKDEILPT